MQTAHKIRVLIVDDSIIARRVLDDGLSRDPRLEVVGHAINASDARRKIALLKPDVLTLDVEMPGQSGLEFLKEYIPQNPLPVVLCSSLNIRVFDALCRLLWTLSANRICLSPAAWTCSSENLRSRFAPPPVHTSAQPQPFKELCARTPPPFFRRLPAVP